MISGEGSAFELVRCETNEEWRERRKEGVGGSDVAALMGLSPWKSPLELWLEKTGREQAADISDEPYVRFGTDFEPIIGRRYKEEHPSMQVKRVNAMCRSIARPWALASLDYEIKDYVSDTWGVLEIKTARSAKGWEDGVPLHYQCQVLHYLSVTQRDYAHVCVFFRDTCEYAVYIVRPDAEDLKAVEEAVDDFWNNYVVKDVMPAVGASDAPVLSDYYGNGSGEIEFADNPSEFDRLCVGYRAAAQAEKDARQLKGEYAALLQKMIADRRGVESSAYRALSIRTTRRVLDTKKFKAEQPEMWARYSEEKTGNGGIKIKEIG